MAMCALGDAIASVSSLHFYLTSSLGILGTEQTDLGYDFVQYAFQGMLFWYKPRHKIGIHDDHQVQLVFAMFV